MRPTNLASFKVPARRLERSVDALVNMIERHWSALLMAAILALWAGVMDADYQELAAADKRAAEDAQAQRDQAADWNRHNRVRLVLEGPHESVANMAQQFANLPK